MKLSVIVASYNSPATLEACLRSLVSQLDQDAEIIVSDCSSQDPRLEFQQLIPGVRFLRFEKRLTIPELRREGLQVAKGEIVLLTEARLVPSYHWAAALLEAHQTHPQAPAVGGPIDHKPASAFDDAVFFCEYGRHMPPTGDGECEELSGGNLSYKRWALELCWDLILAGTWEPFLHRRLEDHGHKLWRAGKAAACYQNSLSVSQAFRQRFHYGRWFASLRVQDATPLGRLVYAGFCPLLPWLLTWRLGRLAFQRRHLRAFLRALIWIALLQISWSFGEFCGYLAGKGSSDRQVF